MYRYSTRPISLTMPFNPKECDVFRIVIKQGKIKLIKTKEELAEQLERVEKTDDGKYKLTFCLTQEESGNFNYGASVRLQIDFKIGTLRDSTNIVEFEMKDVLEEGVI